MPAALSAQSGQRDCDSNAVIHCGVSSTAELKQKFNQDQSIRIIFAGFGISKADVQGMNSSNTKQGVVTKDGKVMVNGEVVATGAMTGGRQNMPGSHQVTRNGVTFFKRPPSVSFQQSQLDALVVMRNGQFQFAVLNSCGNMVTATPKKPQKPQKPVARQVPKPKPTPPAAPVQQQQQQQQQQSVVIEQQPAQVVEQPAAAEAPAPQAQPQPQPQGKELPNTGPGEVAGASAVVGIGSTMWYMVYGRLRRMFM